MQHSGDIGRSTWALALHGGAGSARGTDRDDAAHVEERAALALALDAGGSILADGGSSLDAVEVAVRVLEDSPLFNAGRGAVFNSAGEHELDASIMDGRLLRAGAVAAVREVKNPITLARAVMDLTTEVLLVGDGALALARRLGLELAGPDWFFSERRWRALEDARAAASRPDEPPRDFSTVGAVALDCDGHLAAATSTGGLTNKPPGRVGDSALIGAGTYASDVSCAVSATGSGEHLIRATIARDIAAAVELGGYDLATAIAAALRRLRVIGGLGGVVALDRNGRIAFDFNTDLMFRGMVAADQPRRTAVWRDD
jgi:L-asparaginase / beta-aspartyl-peptidase